MPPRNSAEINNAAVGTHLIADFHDAKHLTDLATIECALRTAAKAASAVLLDLKLHQFGDTGGITGVALLAESHISIHTWPEYQYAALDIFICGESNPHLALQALESVFEPKRVELQELKRGQRCLQATAPDPDQ